MVPASGSTLSRTAGRERSQEAFAALASLDQADPAREALRAELAALHRPLALSLARRFANRGEATEDLEQVAMLGLVKAIDRYDPAQGAAFSSFATPTVLGEVRRHFRDTAWAVRMPRGLQEATAAVNRAVAHLTSVNGRAPNASEIATHLGIDREKVIEALEASEAYSTVPIEAPRSADGLSLAETMGRLDSALERVEEHAALRPLLAELTERDRDILYLRFFEEMSQSQIADQVGISQMHVSRLLARALTQLRAGLQTAEPA